MARPEAVGIYGAEFTMDIERGKIREFAMATSSAHPEYLVQDCPPTPPTFLTTTFFWYQRDSNPWTKAELDPARALHAEQEFIFFGPPPSAGQRLTCQSRITDCYSKRGRRGGALTFVVMTTEFRDDQGNLVAQSIMTGVEPADEPPSPQEECHDRRNS